MISKDTLEALAGRPVSDEEVRVRLERNALAEALAQIAATELYVKRANTAPCVVGRLEKARAIAREALAKIK